MMGLGSLTSLLISVFNKDIVSLPQYDNSAYANIFTKPWHRVFGLALGILFAIYTVEYSKVTEQASRAKKYVGNMTQCSVTLWVLLSFVLIVLTSIFQYYFIILNPFP